MDVQGEAPGLDRLRYTTRVILVLCVSGHTTKSRKVGEKRVVVKKFYYSIFQNYINMEDIASNPP